MAEVKYKSIYTGVQVDNAISSFVNTIGDSESKDVHTADYQALIKSVLEIINPGHFIMIGEDGLVKDSGISDDGLEVTTNKVTVFGPGVTDEQYFSAKCIYDLIDGAFSEIDIDEK